jgi:hypothetical protein
MFGISVLPNLKFHAETVNQQFDKWLILYLKLLSFIEDFFDENFKLNTRTILALNKGLDDFVKFISVTIQFYVQISKLIKDKLFSLPIFKEEQRNEIFLSELSEFLSCKPCAIIRFLLAKIVF